MIKISKITKLNKLFVLLVFLFILTPIVSITANNGYPCTPCPPGYYQFETGVPLLFQQCQCVPSQNFISFLNEFIKTKLFPLAGFIGFLIVIYAGFEYALSGGDERKQKDAQQKIQNVIIGIGLLFLMWLILYIINPNILNTKNLELPQFNFNNNNNNINYNIDNIDTSGTLSAFITTAKNFAANHQVELNCTNYTSDPNVTNYVNYLKRAHYDCDWGVSCDHYIATAMRASNLDKDYPFADSTDQYYYAASNPDKYYCFNVIDASSPQKAGVQNGDILFFSTHGNPKITNETTKDEIKKLIDHTALWIDNCRWQASYGEYLPNKRDSVCWWYGQYQGQFAKVIAICRHK